MVAFLLGWRRSFDWTTIRGAGNYEGPRSSTKTNSWGTGRYFEEAVDRLLCLWLYNRYRYGLHTKPRIWPSARTNFLGRHLPRALGTVPSYSSWQSHPCQQQKDCVLSPAIYQWWTWHGRILVGTPWLDQWNSISDKGLHAGVTMKNNLTTTTKKTKQKTKPEQPIRAVFKWLSKNQNQSNYSDQSQQ